MKFTKILDKLIEYAERDELKSSSSPRAKPSIFIEMCVCCGDKKAVFSGLCDNCKDAHSRGYHTAYLSGRCRSGNDNAGQVVHALLLDDQNKALCGKKPGKLSALGFYALNVSSDVTCERCKTKL